VLTNHFSQASGPWPDRHQTCTRWTPGQRASTVCSRSRSKVTWYGHFCTGTNIASWELLRYVELFIIRVKLAIYFLHFNKVRQVAARLRAKSAIYDCLVVVLFYFRYSRINKFTVCPSSGVGNMALLEPLIPERNWYHRFLRLFRSSPSKWGDWKCETEKCGTKMQDVKMQDWKIRHKNPGMENARKVINLV